MAGKLAAVQARANPCCPSCHGPALHATPNSTYPSCFRPLPRRALSYVLIAALLGGSLYGVARLGRVGLLGTGSSRGSGDGFPLGTSTGQQQQQQQHQHPPVHVHEDAPDRRAALEQHAAEAAALGAAAAGGGLHGGGGGGIDAPVLDAGADSEQAELEAEHLARLQALEAQGHDPHTAAHVAAHIAEQQSLPQREGPSLYASNLSGALWAPSVLCMLSVCACCSCCGRGRLDVQLRPDGCRSACFSDTLRRCCHGRTGHSACPFTLASTGLPGCVQRWTFGATSCAPLT